MTQPYVIPNDSATGAFVLPQGDSFGSLGRGLAEMGIGLGSVINPDSDYQEQIKNAISSRPELLQGFIALKNDNPEAYALLSKRFPRSVRAAIEVGQETPEQKLASARARTELEQLNLSEPHIKALANIPTSQLAQMDLTPAELNAVRGLTGREPGESAQIAREGAVSADVRQYYQGLPDDLKKEVDQYEIPYFRHLQDVADMEQMRKDLIKEHQRDRVNDWRDRMHAMTIEMAMRKYGGSPELWDQYYSDPKIQNRARDLANGTIPALNENDQMLQQMGMAINSEPARRRALATNQLLRIAQTTKDKITGLNPRVTPDDDETINSVDVPMLQQLYDQIASPMYGGPRVRVSYGEQKKRTIFGHEIPFTEHGPKLHITDEQGNDVPENILDQMPMNPSGANPVAVAAMLRSNPQALEAWRRISQTPDQITQGLAALHDSDVSHKVPLQNGLWWAITKAIKRVEPTPTPSAQEEP